MKTTTIPPHMQLAIMSRDYVVSRSIHAIANLGIADHMSDTPVSVSDLALKTGTVPDLLDRVLNFLSVYGLFAKTGDHYALTELSYPLKQDHPFSIKDILAMVDESWWQAFAHLETALKTGNTAFQHQHGTDFFDFLAHDEHKRIAFQKGLARLSVYDDKAIANAFNFGHYQNIVNLGENTKNLSKAILDLYPNLSVATQAFLINEEFKLPSADAYLIKGILHDLDDGGIKRILNTCKQQMLKKASLIIAEQVIPDHMLPHTNKTMDIIMMVLVGGRQRNLVQWQELIESSGFKLKSTAQTEGVYMVMEYLV